MKALLDANFLMIPGKFGVDILSELLSLGYTEIFTVDRVIDELKGISVNRGKEGRNARVGLEFVRKGRVVVLESEEEEADDEILRLAKTKEYVPCTMDRELIKRIKDARLRYVFLRQGKYLVEAGDAG